MLAAVRHNPREDEDGAGGCPPGAWFWQVAHTRLWGCQHQGLPGDMLGR